MLAYGWVLFVDLTDINRVWGVSMRLFPTPLFIAALYWLWARLSSVGHRGLAVATSWSALGPFLALTLLEAHLDNVTE